MKENKHEYGRIINGDCLEIMDKLILEGIKVDCVITDLPYNTTNAEWDKDIIDLSIMWEKLNRLSKDNCAFVMFGSEPFGSKLRMSNIKNYKYDLYWDKIRGVGHLNAKKQPLKSVETISIFYKKQCTYNPQMRERDKPRVSKNNNSQEIYGKSKDDFIGDTLDKKYPITLISYSKSAKKDMMYHSSQKPTDLLEYLLKTYSNENELVLDITAGSCSLAQACINTNRNFICIEKDEHYYEIGVNRINGYVKEN